MQHRQFAVSLSSPLHTARETLTERTGFVVSVDTPNHGRGVGEATPLPGWTESITACETALKDAHTTNPSAVRLGSIDASETPAARHGLALALADAAARDADRSLSAHLAAHADLPSPAASVPVNATVGDADPEETARAAARAATAGYRTVKLKVGARTLTADLERVRAAREAVGPAVALRVDVNGAWTFETARRALDQLSALDVAYVEQPLPAADIDATARLRAATDVPIALDESLTVHSVTRVLAADCTDVIVIKPMALGGPDTAIEAAAEAIARGVKPVVTTTIDAVIARTAAVHVAGAIPNVSACGLATGSLLETDLAADPCPVVDGQIQVPTTRGLAGTSFDDVL